MFVRSVEAYTLLNAGHLGESHLFDGRHRLLRELQLVKRLSIGSHGKYGSTIGREIGTVRFDVFLGFGLFLLYIIATILDLLILLLLLESLKIILVVFLLLGDRLLGLFRLLRNPVGAVRLDRGGLLSVSALTLLY